MAEPSVRTPSAVGPITNRDAARVCTMSGLVAAEKKLATFRELRRGLDLALSDLEQQRRTERLAETGLLVAQLTRASCDAFLSMAESMVGMFMSDTAGRQAGLVTAAAGVATPLAQAGASAFTGGGVDVGATMTEVAKAATGFLPNDKAAKAFIKSQSAKVLADASVLKMEIVRHAANKDRAAVIRSAADYGYDLHATLAGIMGYDRVEGFANIAKAAFDYNQQIGDAFDEMLDLSASSQQRHEALRKTMLAQGRRLSATIAKLVAYVDACRADAQTT